MNKTIEKKFFKAFELGGVVDMCFDWMRQKYDLGFKASKEDEEQPPQELPEEWRHYYDEELPQIINELTDAFDGSVINYTDSPLMDEIANNLDSLTGRNRDVYIFSLLKPFKKYSDTIHPTAVIKELNGEIDGVVGIKDYERDLEMWENLPADEQIEDVNGRLCSTPKEQADACRRFIQDYKFRIERVNYVANRYRDLLLRPEDGAACMQKGTVEHCMSHFFFVIPQFANLLDALLLERGINLLWYQRECGIYLKSYRCVTDVDYYVGGIELAYRYINEALPKLDEQPTQPQHIEVVTATTQQPAQFDVELSYVENIYKFLSGDTLPDSISKKMFVDCVQSGNFKPIWKTTGTKKAKLKYAIYSIGTNRDDNWYKQSAKSIGCKPQQCSGAKVDSRWKKAIIRIK